MTPSSAPRGTEAGGTQMAVADTFETAGAGPAYRLLIKELLSSALTRSPEQEIVYRDLSRYRYGALRERVGQLAGGLDLLGISPGDTVAVMDWDSHRYLECFFAVPMMGAVLQTVNVRLSSDQILYTLNHAGADVLLFNAECAPVISAIRAKLESVRKFVLINDGDAAVHQCGPRRYPARSPQNG